MTNVSIENGVVLVVPGPFREAEKFKHDADAKLEWNRIMSDSVVPCFWASDVILDKSPVGGSESQ